MNFRHPLLLQQRMIEVVTIVVRALQKTDTAHIRLRSQLPPYNMPSRTAKGTQKPARKQQLPMPRDSDDSEVDEFETERRQRGMYDDSDEESGGDSAEQYAEDSEEGEGSEAESSEMARQRWQGWQADELDGQEEEFTEESDDEDEGGAEEDSEEEVPRRKSSKTDQDRLASLRKGKFSFSWPAPMHSLISVILRSGTSAPCGIVESPAKTQGPAS